MNQVVSAILALLAVLILSLALSTTNTGAKLVTGVLIIAIVAVVLRNATGVVAASQGIASSITKPPAKQTGT